jgi:hypothetical protein
VRPSRLGREGAVEAHRSWFRHAEPRNKGQLRESRTSALEALRGADDFLRTTVRPLLQRAPAPPIAAAPAAGGPRCVSTRRRNRCSPGARRPHQRLLPPRRLTESWVRSTVHCRSCAPGVAFPRSSWQILPTRERVATHQPTIQEGRSRAAPAEETLRSVSVHYGSGLDSKTPSYGYRHCWARAGASAFAFPKPPALCYNAACPVHPAPRGASLTMGEEVLVTGEV